MRILIGNQDITPVIQKGKRFLTGLCFCVVLYFYIFNPPFQALPLSPIKLLYPVFIFYFLFRLNVRNYIKTTRGETTLFALIIGYSFLVELISGIQAPQEELLFRTNLFSYIETILFSYIIVQVVNRYFPRTHIYNFLFPVTLLAGCITMYMIVNPLFALYVRNSVLVTGETLEKLYYRGFGIADSLLYTYATAQGLMLAVVLYYSYTHKWLLLTVPVFVVAIIFNARIGLVPPMLMVAYCFMKRYELKRIYPILFYSVILLLMMQSLSFLEDYQKTLEWAGDFFIELWNVITGTESDKPNNMDNLKNSIYLPGSVLGFIFGTGRNVYFVEGNNSDIGYMIQLHYGGIIYCILLGLLVLYMYNRLQKQPGLRFFSFLFLFTILATNYKGYFVNSNPGFRLLCLVYFYYLMRPPGKREPEPFW